MNDFVTDARLYELLQEAKRARAEDERRAAQARASGKAVYKREPMSVTAAELEDMTYRLLYGVPF